MKVALIGTVVNSLLGFRSSLIKDFVEKGCVVYAFAIDYSDDSRKKIIELGAIPVEYKLSRTGLNPICDLIALYRLASILKNLKPDLVFSYFLKPVIYGTLAAKIAGVSNRIGMLEGLGYVFTEGPNGVSWSVRFLRIIQVLMFKFSFPFLNKLIFLNPDDKVDLLDKYSINVKSVEILGGIGVDLSYYSYSSVDVSSISFLFIARLLAEKGVNEFVGAAKIVKKLYPSVEFVLLGGLDPANPGSLSKEELDALISNGIVTYPGYVDDVRFWIKKSSVFVLPSYYREGVPRSTQEAMAIGRAIITTDMPGCRETVVNGENGFLIQPHSNTELADAMIYYINNPHEISRMGDKSAVMANNKYDSRVVNSRLLHMLGVK